MIEVRRLRKRFGAITAVADVSFAAADGQITGLLGPNGAGKTTTLRMLYGLIEPDRGELRVDGIDVRREPQRAQSRLGALPDSRGLYPRLSARENVRYYGWLHGMKGAALERRIDELARLLEWGDVAERRVEGFSQGERMKVAIARALVHQPVNVALDEPTNGLDVMSTRAMREFIRSLRAEGRCVLFSSHVMQEVSALCDRIVVIARGRVVAAGTPDELRAEVGVEDLEEVFVALTRDDDEAADPPKEKP
ncbi:MAG: ATP-binding cassette domain-containing protein [Deltaproteobacteria bacterium]|jgi:sodium transport system ATP-binding protein|nr:ATP-binding cassette domain-containing protein [Deltaproteobacteria bacterium]MBW2536810.1 ATP-binding cassette domain-containing protein [Deltaproteobacteria bacterium]